MLQCFSRVIFPNVIWSPSQITTTSSFLRFIISSFTVSTMALIPVPGFTKLDTAKVEPRQCWSSAALFLAWLSPIIIVFWFTRSVLLALWITDRRFLQWLFDDWDHFIEGTYPGNSLSSLRLAGVAKRFQVSRDSCRRFLLVYCSLFRLFDEKEVQSSLANKV